MQKIGCYPLTIGVLLVLVSGYCYAVSHYQPKTPAFTAQDAIAKYKSKYVCDYPDQPGVWLPILRNIGGPGIRIPFDVETEVEQVGEDTYIITFHETWHAYDAHDPDQTKDLMSHQSKFKITPNSITPLGESGNREPDFPQ